MFIYKVIVLVNWYILIVIVDIFWINDKSINFYWILRIILMGNNCIVVLLWVFFIFWFEFKYWFNFVLFELEIVLDIICKYVIEIVYNMIIRLVFFEIRVIGFVYVDSNCYGDLI